MEQEKEITAESMLKEVNNAIFNVLVGGQSYKIGSRQLTRADLSMLREMKKRARGSDQRGVRKLPAG